MEEKLRSFILEIYKEYDKFKTEQYFIDFLLEKGIIYKYGWTDTFIEFIVSPSLNKKLNWKEWGLFYIVEERHPFGGAPAELMIPKYMIKN